ncbi:MAG: DUF616 domain-containing protein [Oscillospiraceae bacterium]|jgi:hypothetical protein|nr:DUF616 domain-containing protein [Oscillospiraceae bacterium]
MKEFTSQIVYPKFCLFGAGNYGIEVVGKALILLGITPVCFVDNDVQKHGKMFLSDIPCYLPDKYPGNKNEEYCCVAVHNTNYKSVLESAKKAGFKKFISTVDLLASILENPKFYEDSLDIFDKNKVRGEFLTKQDANKDKIVFTENSIEIPNGRIAVYTTLFGEYDIVRSPKVYPENIDYYYVSDTKEGIPTGWEWVDATNYLPEDLESSLLKARFIKTHPHLLFPEYDWSIYLDSNVMPVNDISKYCVSSNTDIVMFIHPRRDCIYHEALTVVSIAYSLASTVKPQMSKYRKQGMPSRFGLTETSVIVRKHNTKLCVQLMEEWWEEVYNKSKRDQLSFMYVIWKNGFMFVDIGILDKSDLEENSDFDRTYTGRIKSYSEL